MDTVAGIRLIIKSEGYRDARRRIDYWISRIESGAKPDAKKALLEKNRFFSSMRKKSPGLYALLEADDRMLSRLGVLKATGVDAIFD